VCDDGFDPATQCAECLPGRVGDECIKFGVQGGGCVCDGVSAGPSLMLLFLMMTWFGGVRRRRRH
jgi:hypothetical protein